MLRPVLVLAALLLIAPTASAGWFAASEPPAVHVPASKVGDRLQYLEDRRWTDYEYDPDSNRFVPKVKEDNFTQVSLLEGPGHATDAYGIDRPTLDSRHDTVLAGDLTSSERCHRLQGSLDTVSVEPLTQRQTSASWSSGGAFGPLGAGSTRSEGFLLARFGGTPCFATNAFAGRTIHEGERLTLADLFGDVPPEYAALPTNASTKVPFHGREALRFAFDESAIPDEGGSGEIWVILADGIPGLAGFGHNEGPDQRSSSQLVGFAPGDGAVVPPVLAGVRLLPERDPAGRFAAYDPLRFDDAAFHLPFSYAEAFAYAMSKPNSPLKEFLDAHPDAWLISAYYMREAFSPAPTDVPGTAPDGTWMLMFTDGKEATGVFVSRQAASVGPIRQSLTPLSDPFEVLERSGSSRVSGTVKRPAAAELASSTRSAARAAASGVRTDDVQSLSYSASGFGGRTFAYLSVSDLHKDGNDAKGRSAGIDLVSGGLAYVGASEFHSEGGGLLPTAGSGTLDATPRVSTLSALAGPGLGEGLAGGAVAATGLALLLVGLKFFLLPFYTRLRRATLLDNPVRARLYERIRAEPGIHQAELVDFAGVGRAPTARHLRQLASHGFVVEMDVDGRARYYARGEVPPELAREHALLRSESMRRVHDLLAREPHLSLREAAARLGVSAPSVYRAKSRLRKAGLIRN